VRATDPMEWVVTIGLLAVAGVVLAGMAECSRSTRSQPGGQLSGLAVGLLLAGARLEELVIVVLAVVRGPCGIAAGMRSART